MGGQGSTEEARLASGAVHLRDKMAPPLVGRMLSFSPEGSFRQDVGVGSGEALTESHEFSLDLAEVSYRAEQVEKTFHPLGGAGREQTEERVAGARARVGKEQISRGRLSGGVAMLGLARTRDGSDSGRIAGRGSGGGVRGGGGGGVLCGRKRAGGRRRCARQGISSAPIPLPFKLKVTPPIRSLVNQLVPGTNYRTKTT